MQQQNHSKNFAHYLISVHRAIATRGGVGGGATPPDNCSQAISGRFPADFQVNSGNSPGIKKRTLCSESELELTIDQLKDVERRHGRGGHGQIPFLTIWRLRFPKFSQFS